MVGRKEGLEEEHKRVALPEPQEAGESKGTMPLLQPAKEMKWVEVQRHHQGLVPRLNFQIPYLLLL